MTAIKNKAIRKVKNPIQAMETTKRNKKRAL